MQGLSVPIQWGIIIAFVIMCICSTIVGIVILK